MFYIQSLERYMFWTSSISNDCIPATDCTIIYKYNTLKHYKHNSIQSQIQIEHGPVLAIKKLWQDALIIYYCYISNFLVIRHVTGLLSLH